MGGILSALLGREAAESSDPSSLVISFHSASEWQLHFNEYKESNKLMVVDFAASWCGPCRFMEPIVKDMAARFTDVNFVKIDVDELSDVTKEYKVQAMPTFLLLKQGKEVARIVGANKDELENKILKFRGTP